MQIPLYKSSQDSLWQTQHRLHTLFLPSGREKQKQPERQFGLFHEPLYQDTFILKKYWVEKKKYWHLLLFTVSQVLY